MYNLIYDCPTIVFSLTSNHNQNIRLMRRTQTATCIITFENKTQTVWMLEMAKPLMKHVLVFLIFISDGESAKLWRWQRRNRFGIVNTEKWENGFQYLFLFRTIHFPRLIWPPACHPALVRVEWDVWWVWYPTIYLLCKIITWLHANVTLGKKRLKLSLNIKNAQSSSLIR